MPQKIVCSFCNTEYEMANSVLIGLERFHSIDCFMGIRKREAQAAVEINYEHFGALPVTNSVSGIIQLTQREFNLT